MQQIFQDPTLRTLAIVALAFGMYKAGVAVIAMWKSHAQVQLAYVEAVRILADAMDGVDLTKLTEIIAAAALTSEKLHAGTIKACEAIVTATERHREAVASFEKKLFAEAGKDAIQVASDGDRDRTYSEMAHRAGGKSPEEAADLAEQEAAQPASYTMD